MIGVITLIGKNTLNYVLYVPFSFLGQLMNQF